MPPLTAQQQAAVAATGNVLLMAGAGTGKTSTLVARCLHWLFQAQPKGSLDRLLMVTFTEAAATEMRERIREALCEHSRQAPHAEHAQMQLALLDTVHIQTLHSFNLQLVRRHFLELKFDPQATVLYPQQAQWLQEQVLEELWSDLLSPSSTEGKSAHREWLKSLGPGAEDRARHWLLSLYRRWRTRPDPEGWLNSQLECLKQLEPTYWKDKIPQALDQWRQLWHGFLQTLGEEHYADDEKVKLETLDYARGFAGLLHQRFTSLEETREVLSKLLARNQEWPWGQTTIGRKPLKKLFEEAENFLSYLPDDNHDPLKEDWALVRPWLATLLELLGQFHRRYSHTKRQQGALDFNDFEQFALQLLYDNTGKPSAIARQWRERFDFVLVDEYQDINPAQDAILRALSREENKGNRFLVGDVKQSIYRFREADPKIFQRYAQEWSNAQQGQVLKLSENFRSCEAILDFVNHFFTGLMMPEVGGVAYNAEASLQFGAPQERHKLSRQQDPPASRRVELNLVVTGRDPAADGEDEAPAASGDEEEDINKLKAEARLVARRLLKIKNGNYPVWRRQEKQFTPADWRDMVILLRAPRNRTQVFVQELNQAGIPLRAEDEDFLNSQETRDLLNVLRLLDNPRQDLPLLAVLRSPLVGLKLDDLAAIRAANRKGGLWSAVECWLAQPPAPDAPDSPRVRVMEFLKRFQRWRGLARRGSLVTCLETILNDTLYDAWCQTQPGGAQRHANIQHLLHLARHFDTLQRQGLHRFLEFVEAYAKLELPLESPQTVTENCVQLMSIHGSKGLEFPIVVVAALGTQFNFSSSTEEILWDDELGLCPRVHPAGRPCYASLVRELAQDRLRIEQMGEELRLFYVAFTRACDLLILTGSTAEAQFNRWKKTARQPTTPKSLINTQMPLQWVVKWWLNHTPAEDLQKRKGRNSHLQWRIWNVETIARLKTDAAAPPAGQADAPAAAADLLEQWKTLKDAQYPALAATREAAKTHVSALRRRAAMEADAPAEGRWLPQATPVFAPQAKWSEQTRGMKAGTAHHDFLEHLSLAVEPTLENLKEQAQQMVEDGLLFEEEVSQLHWDSLVRFWNSEIGRTIRAHHACVQREIPFTARFSRADLASVGIPVHPYLGPEEFMVVQGVADLVVLLEDEIWVLDYKTDRLTLSEVADRAQFYAPQVRLYALALSQIFERRATHVWLHFLALGRTVEVPPPD